MAHRVHCRNRKKESRVIGEPKTFLAYDRKHIDNHMIFQNENL